MAKNPKGTLQAVTANRLRDGAVVFRTGTGGWSTAIGLAEVTHDDGGAARLLAGAELDAAAAIVVGPYLIAVIEEGGSPRPVSLRERIRADGPSISPIGADAVPYL